MHPRNITLHDSDAAPAAASRQLGEGCSLALKQRDFSAAAAAAAAGGDGGADYAAWLCTEQDPSYSAPEVLTFRLNLVKSDQRNRISHLHITEQDPSYSAPEVLSRRHTHVS